MLLHVLKSNSTEVDVIHVAIIMTTFSFIFIYTNK